MTAREENKGVVQAVVCLFCECWRREVTEDEVPDGRKRKSTTNNKHWKDMFRSDNIHKHMQEQHPKKFEEYEALRKVASSTPEFLKGLLEQLTVDAFFKKRSTYVIVDDGSKVVSCYKVTIANPLQFDYVVFLLAAVLLIRHILRSWAFAVASDVSTDDFGNSHLNMRIRFLDHEVGDNLLSFHLMAIPLFEESHTGESLFNFFVKVFDALYPMWKYKLIGVEVATHQPIHGVRLLQGEAIRIGPTDYNNLCVLLTELRERCFTKRDESRNLDVPASFGCSTVSKVQFLVTVACLELLLQGIDVYAVEFDAELDARCKSQVLCGCAILYLEGMISVIKVMGGRQYSDHKSAPLPPCLPLELIKTLMVDFVSLIANHKA
ncbi:hypothetical protein AXG93_3833s1130 [Marchantia polymorpha subsp. ruderalis]|uniref:Uncharacterized protein n=1 Tax=Marchantia polymorpha subsp. ruderalis TaxID=1480154 RepID=A0A176VMP8_MARPO|nr:hypothetical protein AXG93_3833s1130 [Marchantia polymorpha subsp. ruderalis]